MISVSSGQFGREILHGSHRLAGTVVGELAALDFNCVKHVVTIDDVGTGRILSRLDGAQRHHAGHIVLGCTNVELRYVTDICPVLRLGLHHHFIHLPELIELIDVDTAQKSIKRSKDVRERNAQRDDLGPIHGKLDLRRIRSKRGKRSSERGYFDRLGD